MITGFNNCPCSLCFKSFFCTHSHLAINTHQNSYCDTHTYGQSQCAPEAVDTYAVQLIIRGEFFFTLRHAEVGSLKPHQEHTGKNYILPIKSSIIGQL